MSGQPSLAVTARWPGWPPALLLLAVPWALAACQDTPGLDADARVWGTYSVCLRRIADSCQDSDGRCASPSARGLDDVTLAVRPDGTLLWTRDGLAPLRGRQSGTRFEVVHRERVPVEGCACVTTVEEQLHGELEWGYPPRTDCEAPDAVCGPPQRALPIPPPLGFGPPVQSDEGFPSVRGTLQVRVQPGPDDGCRCGPCTVVYAWTAVTQ